MPSGNNIFFQGIFKGDGGGISFGRGSVGLVSFFSILVTNIKTDFENPTIGVLLCADKNDAVVKYTLPEDEQNIFATRYKLYLPTEAEILAEIKREQELLEQELRLRTATPTQKT